MGQVKKNSVSLVKALGIILMVVGHSGCPEILERFIYLFHMPLFFVFSGYFFKQTSFKEGRTFLWKKIKGLYVPFIKYGLLFVILHNLFVRLNVIDGSVYTYHEMIKNALKVLVPMYTTESLISPFWFLKCLLLSSILVFVINSIVDFRRKYLMLGIVAVLVLITAFCVSRTLYLPMIGDTAIIPLAAIFIIVGRYYREIEEKTYVKNSWLQLFILMCLVLTAVLVHEKWGFDSLKTYMVVPFVFTGVVGTILIHRFCISYKFLQNDFLYFVGSNTLIILALHEISFKLVSFIYIKISGIGNLQDFPTLHVQSPYLWIIYTLVGVMLPIGLYFLKNKVTTVFLKS